MMVQHPVIPEHLRSDHLFLLVGANPLPNWVAAKLLLKPNGTAYLVHSREEALTNIARRLAKSLISQNYRQPEYIELGGMSRSGDDYRSVSDAGEVYRAFENRLKEIRSGSIGFNYTGGTKVMSVHGYRALENELPAGIPRPVFSYLDASSLEMRFDPSGSLPSGHTPIFVGLAPEVELTLERLLKIHDEKGYCSLQKDPVALPVVNALVDLHYSGSLKTWRQWITALKRIPIDQKTSKTLEGWPPDCEGVANALAAGRPHPTTLGELCSEHVWPFEAAAELIEWLDGKWLESCVLNLLKQLRDQCRLNDFGRNLEVHCKCFDCEADVAAIRGYQLHFISCYTGSKTPECTQKLFEAAIRARQIGGEEACTALVCMSEDPQSIENDVRRAWQAEGRVKVFGRKDLHRLGECLMDWFHEGISRKERR